jgi:hypothetical protein
MWPFKKEEVKKQIKFLEFDEKYFEFNECINFTIRRGINHEYYKEQIVKLIPNTPDFFLPALRDARITSIRHMRFCDIPNFAQWHLSTEKHDPLVVMMDIYGEDFSKKELVTLIGFKVL